MVTSVLPLYAVFALGLTPLQFGVIDGLYQGASALARLVGGVLADRWRRNREVAAVGYGVSAVCKLGVACGRRRLGRAGRGDRVDRIGKGIRTPPRDALISLSERAAAARRSRSACTARSTRSARCSARSPRSRAGAAARRLRRRLRHQLLHRAASASPSLLLFVGNPRRLRPSRRPAQPSLRTALRAACARRAFARVVLGVAALGLMSVGRRVLLPRNCSATRRCRRACSRCSTSARRSTYLRARGAGRPARRPHRSRARVPARLWRCCSRSTWCSLAPGVGAAGWTAWLTLDARRVLCCDRWRADGRRRATSCRRTCARAASPSSRTASGLARLVVVAHCSAWCGAAGASRRRCCASPPA